MKRMFWAVVVLVLVVACSGDDDEAAPPAESTTSTAQSPGTTVPEPDGPVADVSEELSGGNGIFVGAPEDREDEAGYGETEFAATGTAEAYVPSGPLSGDGMWTLEADRSADYATRVIVRAPDDAEDFSGVVLLEWMNVSGGVDADPEWSTLREEAGRQGHVWVGVSAQALGIEGGEVRVSVGDVEGSESAGKGLRAIDPDRYGDLIHPGDAYAYDIYSQIARAVRQGVPGTDLTPSTLLAVGESQSAFALVTYINGFQPMTDAFDGFFVHSRGGTGLPVDIPDGEPSDLAGSLAAEPTILRADTDVPIMVLQAENDVTGPLQGINARQEDTDTFRLWEVAGTAHADLRLVGASTAAVIDCGAPINNGPLHVVAKAAFRALVDWVVDGTAPPEAPRLELVDDQSAISRDADGIALGGVRTPPVDVPTQVLTGVAGPKPEIICILSGSTLDLPAPAPSERYGTAEDYLAAYDAAIDQAVEAGFVLDEDRAALEDYANPDLVAG